MINTRTRHRGLPIWRSRTQLRYFAWKLNKTWNFIWVKYMYMASQINNFMHVRLASKVPTLMVPFTETSRFQISVASIHCRPKLQRTKANFIATPFVTFGGRPCFIWVTSWPHQETSGSFFAWARVCRMSEIACDFSLSSTFAGPEVTMSRRGFRCVKYRLFSNRDSAFGL